MLQHMRIENFRCLKSMDVPLRPLTVLIGANDTGKSAFLAALQRWASGENHSVSDYWRNQTSLRIILNGTYVESDRTQVRFDWQQRCTPLGQIGHFQLPSAGPSMLTDGYSDESGPQMLGTDGRGVPSLLDYLLRRDRRRFFALRDAMRELIPGLEEVEIATPHPAHRRLDLVMENGFRIPADQVSSGVRLLLFFLALAYHPTPPKLILIEEPESGVHPQRLADVMRLLREITQGKHGDRAAQVVLTTHSPYLLDLVNLKTDQVLVFHRNDDGSRTAEAADAQRLSAFLDEFMLGEVWYNQGEEGLVARPA